MPRFGDPVDRNFSLEARALAALNRATVAEGGDPLAEKRRARPLQTRAGNEADRGQVRLEPEHGESLRGGANLVAVRRPKARRQVSRSECLGFFQHRDSSAPPRETPQPARAHPAVRYLHPPSVRSPERRQRPYRLRLRRSGTAVAGVTKTRSRLANSRVAQTTRY